MKRRPLERIGRVALLLAVFALGVACQRTGLLDDILYYTEDILYLSQQHLVLTLISGGMAILVGVPLGVWLSRPGNRARSQTWMQVLNIGGTVPTLALLALSMSFLGIGAKPAVFGLFVATLLPIVRNTWSGLMDVPPHLIEAAEGIGMSPMQVLLRVEVPNALFVIYAGIRTALSINIGTVPLAFLIGGGGLGELIFTGIDLYEPGMMLAGAIPTAILAVLVDMFMTSVTYITVPRGVNPLRA